MSEERPIPEAPDEIPGKPIGWVLVATALSVLAAGVVVWALAAFDLFGGGESRAPDVGRSVTAVPPREPFSPRMEAPLGLEVRRADAWQQLDAYSWADPAHTRVRLPANAAIDRYVAGHGGGR